MDDQKAGREMMQENKIRLHRMGTKAIHIGEKVIGGGNPILIQSMTNTPTENVAATVEQIHRLEKAGCEIIRCTVPTMEAAVALREIKKQISIPLVADIHFDYKMAVAAIENGADKIRINPGNIGGKGEGYPYPRRGEQRFFGERFDREIWRCYRRGYRGKRSG